MPKDSIVNETCTKCWGAQTLADGVAGGRALCPRCKGTGEEPPSAPFWLIGVVALILVVFLFAIWSIPRE